MQSKPTLSAAVCCLIGLWLHGSLLAQSLEVEGQAKISNMNTDNTSSQVVVRQVDGTLAVREISTFSPGDIDNYGTVINPLTGKVWLDRNLGATRVADTHIRHSHESGYQFFGGSGHRMGRKIYHRK